MFVIFYKFLDCLRNIVIVINILKYEIFLMKEDKGKWIRKRLGIRGYDVSFGFEVEIK